MYYTVSDTGLAMQCISVATSSTPGGPFVDRSTGPLVCQTATGGSIDPNPFLDPVSGGLYLTWKSDDNSIGQKTHIWGQGVAPTGLTLAAGSSPSLLLTESASWQYPTVEGPTLIRNSGTYYLFYGANSYNSCHSGIGYATSASLLGGYTNRSRYGPWLGTTGNTQGPQGPTVFKDATGATRMAFAAWSGPVGYQNGGARSLWIATLGFGRSGTPNLGKQSQNERAVRSVGAHQRSLWGLPRASVSAPRGSGGGPQRLSTGTKPGSPAGREQPVRRSMSTRRTGRVGANTEHPTKSTKPARTRRPGPNPPRTGGSAVCR